MSSDRYRLRGLIRPQRAAGELCGRVRRHGPDPRVSLLDGDQWATAKDAVLTALALPETPVGLLDDHRDALDVAYRRVAAHLADTNSDLSVDDHGRVHLAALNAIAEPGSLVTLRTTVGAMLPRVDLSQIVLEVMGWERPARNIDVKSHAKPSGE